LLERQPGRRNIVEGARQSTGNVEALPKAETWLFARLLLSPVVDAVAPIPVLGLELRPETFTFRAVNTPRLL
jgi:hypothetical protein